ncbi:MAG: type 4a pilus biogenesis protein PilO [Candidatus Omnitrophica bacterium]|nr:type 4a pilus biogenesis protein PilO [Candidatus Omnitrophota bacterium]
MNANAAASSGRKIPVMVAVLAGAIVVLAALTVPQVWTFVSMSKNIAEKKKTLAAVEDGIRNIETYRREANALDAAYNDFLRRIPAQRDFTAYLELLSQLAGKNGVKIVAIEPQPVVEDPALFYVKIPVFIDAGAGYHQLGAFINDIEFSEKCMKVEAVKIEAGADAVPVHAAFLRVITVCLREADSGG